VASRPAVRHSLEAASPAGKGSRVSVPGRVHRAQPGVAAQSSSVLNRTLSALVYFGLLLYFVYPYSDYDWGWHYRYGEYFFTQGKVLRHDIFSWTMPGYEWVNHSWLFDLVLYVVYTRFGFIGLSVAGALSGLLTFHICVRQARLGYWQTGIVAIFFALLTKDILIQGLRTQVVGLLLLAVLGDLLTRQREGQTWVYWFLPGLFCLWANLHGSFLLGLVVTGVFLGWELVLSQIQGTPLPRRWFYFVGSLVASIAATLINPFTYGVYLEARRHFANPHLTYVVEWMPPNFSELVGLVFLTYTLIVAYGFVSRRSLADVPHLLVAAGTFYMAATTRRHVAVFVVLSLPLVALVLRDVRFRMEEVARTSAAAAVIVAIIGITAYHKREELQDFAHSSMYTYCRYGSQCSEGLAQFLLKHPPMGRGFNFYDWGGFLIGRGVPTKLFIDGRMHLWERSDYQPMADYRAIYVNNDMDAFRRHNFDWFLVPRGSSFIKDLIADETGSPQAESKIWVVAYQDHEVLYAVRRKSGN
jgi:hypothetical protein